MDRKWKQEKEIRSGGERTIGFVSRMSCNALNEGRKFHASRSHGVCILQRFSALVKGGEILYQQTVSQIVKFSIGSLLVNG